MAYVRTVAVRFADLDALNHVNHAAILAYAETVRCDWFQEVRNVVSMVNLPIIIASAHCEYMAPIAKTARPTVAMTVPRIGTKSWTFAYEIGEASTVFAQVETTQVAYDYAAGKSIPIADDLRRDLEAI